MQFFSTFALWLLVFVLLGRFQEIFPFLAPLQLGKVSVAIGLVAVLATNLKDITLLFTKTSIKKYLLAITVLAFFSIPFSVYPGEAINSFIGYLRLLLSSAIIVALASKRPENFQLCLISVLLLLSTQMLLQKVGGRISVSSTYDPNDIAVLCVVYLPFAVHGITQKNFIVKTVSILATGGAVAGVALSGSRGGLLALAAVAIYAIILAKKRRMLLITLCTIGACIFGILAGEEFWFRIQSLIDGTDYNLSESGDSRLAIWGNAFEVMLRRPFFGVGIGQFVTGIATLTDSPWKTAHNSFFQTGVELGFAGLYAFCAIFFALYKLSKYGENASFLTSNQQSLYLFLRISVVAFCVGGFFVSHAYSPITYCLFSMGGVIYIDLKRKEAATNQEKLEKNNIKAKNSLQSQIMIEDKSTSRIKAPNNSSNPKHKEAQGKRNLKKSRLEAGDLLSQAKKNATKI